MPLLPASDKGQPVVWVFTGLNDFQVRMLQCFGNRAAFFITDRVLVDTSDRGYLCGCSGEKNFIGNIERFTGISVSRTS